MLQVAALRTDMTGFAELLGPITLEESENRLG